MVRGALAALVLLCGGMSAAFAQALYPLPPQPAGLAWPTQAWETAPLPADVDRAAFDLAVTQAFAGPDPILGETRAVLIVQSGRIVFERYSEGYDQDMRLGASSAAQSITQALVGVAVAQGRVSIDAPMGSAHWRAGDRRASITWRQWLNMVDGQAFAEADAAHMLYGRGRADTARFAAGLALARDPGVGWRYNAAGPVLIADALTQTIAPDATDRRARLRAWMQEGLFAPLGMHPMIEFDAAGVYGGMWATARDFARFGYLYLRDGAWNGARILPEGWVDFARTRGPDAATDIYGAQFWLTPAHGEGAPERALIQDTRLSDAFAARGEGQLIVVVPSKDLVLVRLGLTSDAPENRQGLGDWTTRMIASFGARPALR